MKKLEKGDFVNYKFKDDYTVNGFSEVLVEIIKIPNDEFLSYNLLRLDNSETIEIKNMKIYENYNILEVTEKHFIALKAEFKVHNQQLKNETINFIECAIGNVSFIQINSTSNDFIPSTKIMERYLAIDNSKILNSEYFDYFFKKIDVLYNLKNDLEKITCVNQLFNKLDLINYDYNKKEIALTLECDRYEQSN